MWPLSDIENASEHWWEQLVARTLGASESVEARKQIEIAKKLPAAEFLFERRFQVPRTRWDRLISSRSYRLSEYLSDSRTGNDKFLSWDAKWRSSVRQVLSAEESTKADQLPALIADLFVRYGQEVLRPWLARLPNNEIRYHTLETMVRVIRVNLQDIVDSDRSLWQELRWINLLTALVSDDVLVMEALLSFPISRSTSAGDPGAPASSSAEVKDSVSDNANVSPAELSGVYQPSGFWVDRWANPALQTLGQWTTNQGYSTDQAMRIVSRVWSFYSYAVVRAFRGYPPMALSVKRLGDEYQVWLRLPEPSTRLSTGSKQSIHEVLQESLAKYERRPVAKEMSLHIEIAGTSENIESSVRGANSAGNGVFLGVYHDDLVAELAKVMNPKNLDVWLKTPNSNFGNHRPEEFLNDPEQDQFLRNIVLDVKYGLAA